MHRLAGPLIGLALALAGPASLAAQPTPDSMAGDDPLHYNQITSFAADTGGLGLPVLSADGSTAVFATSTIDPGGAITTNRIQIIDADGSGLTEVDAFEPRCHCGSWVDISADGETVVATDSMQLRLVSGGAARTLLDLTSNEMSSIRLTASGDRVFFLLGRDTQAVDSPDILQRGIYVINDDGSGLRQIAGPDQIAELLDITPDEVHMLRLQVSALDISADGEHIVFGTYTGPDQAFFVADGDGGNLRWLRDGVAFVQRVAISGDGALVAFDVIPPDTSGQNEIGIVPFTGGAPEILATNVSTGFDQPLQLNHDGSRLLVSSNAFLIDTETGAVRQLAVHTPGGDGQIALLVDDMPRATMDAEARRFLYVIRGTRCADCPNLQEQLATLDIGGEPHADTPSIANATIDPAEIQLEYLSAATASARVTGTGTPIAIGVVALRDGRYDLNVGRDCRLHDDGQVGDVTANDGEFTNNAIMHGPVELRDDDTGPRTMRFQAEFEASDGLRHAMAVDAGTLTIIEGP